nr:ryanodine receptor 2-like [Lytechinus pictus]
MQRGTFDIPQIMSLYNFANLQSISCLVAGSLREYPGSIPPDLSICVFVLDQALSVRALQEMVITDQIDQGGQAGHRTLLYGHAILLQHSLSSMYLACLPTSSSKDKLAFDVGLQESTQGEACWWTIHPVSKQRSEGEKVRVGDDLILVNVATERYLHLSVERDDQPMIVVASFQQTLWTVAPISSGIVKIKAMAKSYKNADKVVGRF